MDGILKGIQDEMAANLRRDSWFQPVKIVTENLGDIANQIELALNKLGLVIVILTPGAKCAYPDAPGPIMDPVTPVAAVYEMVLLNRGANGSKLPCSAVAERVAYQLHYPNHAAARTDSYPLVCTDIALLPDRTYLRYNVTFRSGQIAIGGIPTQEV